MYFARFRETLLFVICVFFISDVESLVFFNKTRWFFHWKKLVFFKVFFHVFFSMTFFSTVFSKLIDDNRSTHIISSFPFFIRQCNMGTHRQKFWQHTKWKQDKTLLQLLWFMLERYWFDFHLHIFEHSQLTINFCCAREREIQQTKLKHVFDTWNL